MNDLNLSYGEVLKIMAQNLDDSYFQFDRLTVDYEGYKLSFNPYTDFFYYMVNDVIESHFGFFDVNPEDYYYLDKKSEIINVPRSDEEWFTFSIIHDCTKVDFENFLKITQYSKKIK